MYRRDCGWVDSVLREVLTTSKNVRQTALGQRRMLFYKPPENMLFYYDFPCAGVGAGIVPKLTRRRMLFFAGAAIFAAPILSDSSADDVKLRRLAILSNGSQTDPARLANVAALFSGLHDLGYREGQNIAVEYRWADGIDDKLPALARDLLSVNPEIIVAEGPNAVAHALASATKTVPVVFVTSDPVASGLVNSLARPGGNLTGINILGANLDPKRLQLLQEMAPNISRVGVLWNPSNPSGLTIHDVETAASKLRLEMAIWKASNPNALRQVLENMARTKVDALLTLADGMLTSERARIIEFAAKNHLPAIYAWRIFAQDGGLMSYGASLLNEFRHAASYVGKILKGDLPANLPVEQARKFELVINLKTVKSLDLAVPPSLLAVADELIE
jgi:putative tryptophan/tyrosine transport system substrate-binding protein